MRKTFQYRALVNKETEGKALRWLDLCRTLYNTALEQRTSVYQSRKVSIGLSFQVNELPILKKENPDFKEVNAQCLCCVLGQLDKSYQNFFRRIKQGYKKAGFPRFKGKDRFKSFTLTQSGWKLEGRYLYIRNVGRFKLFLSRPIEGIIKTVTIKQSANKWFVSFSCGNVPEKTFPKTDREVGIDVGIKNFCVDSDSNVIENPKFFRESEKLLQRRQRSLSRKKRGSANRHDAKLLVSQVHEKIKNQRKDFLHKLTNDYINSYQTIYIEDLNIDGMIKNKHLSKSISDASWGIFFNMLLVKAVEAGRKVIKVNPRNTSQNCSGCGEKVPKTLSTRIHNCPNCGLVLDRDLNAALNIQTLGQRVRALTGALAPVAR